MLAIVVVPLLYDRAARDPFTTPKKAALSVALWGLVALLWTVGVNAGVRGNRALHGLSLVALAGLLSACFAASPTVAAESLRDLFFLAVPAAVLGCTLLRTPRRVLLGANALGLAAFAVSVVGILQHQHLDWWGYRPTLLDRKSTR